MAKVAYSGRYSWCSKTLSNGIVRSSSIGGRIVSLRSPVCVAFAVTRAEQPRAVRGVARHGFVPSVRRDLEQISARQRNVQVLTAGRPELDRSRCAVL
jgi:hypothetical protein